MIQELLGGASLIAGERKPSINGGNSGGGVLLPTTPPLSSLSSSTTNFTTTSTTTTTAATTTTVTSSASENLRCPRCDSSNTKFCYYNNYNLTQPRHFCKTCRRYWTKGGALRNVPIGGGCRKNKNIGVSNSMAKTTSTKMKTIASEVGKTSNFGQRGFEVEHEPPPLGPILWGSPQNTHILDLLRAGQNQNPNPNPSPLSINVKEEGNLLMGHMVSSEPLVSNALLNHRTFGYDAIAQVPSLGPCSSFWRNNQDHQPQHQNGGFVLGDHHNNGIQELYHKLRSSSVNNYCNNDNSSQAFMGNLASNYSSSSSISNNILEPTSVAAGELGYWNNNNPTFSWSDLSTTNGTAGAYP